MTSDLPRVFMILVLLALIVGLLIWARGPDHHHGDDVGAHPVASVTSALRA